MRKTIGILTGLCFLLGLAAVGQAKRPKRRAPKVKVELEVGAKIDVSTKSDKEKPTFVSQRLKLMDRGALLYVGKGMWHEQHRLFFRQLTDGQELVLDTPLAAFLESKPDLFPGAEGSGFPRYMAEAPLFLDRELGLAGLYLRAKPAKGTPKAERVKRHFLLIWDLKAKAIIKAVKLADEDKTVRLVSVRGIGSLPAQNKGLIHVQVWLEGEDNLHQHKILTVGPDGVEQLAAFDTKRDARRSFMAPDASKLLVAEYAELAKPEPAPLGHLVDLETGQVRSLPIPMTSYGAAFAPDGETLFVYSNQTRVIWRIDLASGKKLGQVKVGGGGHALAYGPAGRLVLLSHRGLTFLDPKRLVRRQHIPITKVIQGHAWVPGSVLTRDHAVFKNGDELIFTRLVPPKAP